MSTSINTWATAILNLSRPINTVDNFNAAIKEWSSIKLNIGNIDKLVLEICNIKNTSKDLIEYNSTDYIVVCTQNKRYSWKYLVSFWLSGKIKQVCSILGAKTRISNADESALQFELIQYSYYQVYKLYMQYDNAVKVYPELAILGTSGENLKGQISKDLQKTIEDGLKEVSELYPATILYGTICMFSTEKNRDQYERLYQTLDIAPGCYRIYVNKSNRPISSTCKIVGRSCANKNTLNTCDNDQIDPDNRDGRGSNPFIFLNYLVQGNTIGNVDTLAITNELNATLTNKLTDLASINIIMNHPSDVLIVYNRQLLEHPKFDDCSIMKQKDGVVGCDASLIMYDKDSANNVFTSTVSVFSVLKDQYNLLHLLLDLSNKTKVNILNLDDDGKKLEPIINNNIWLFITLIGFIVLVIVIGIILYLTTNYNRKDQKYMANNSNIGKQYLQ